MSVPAWARLEDGERALKGMNEAIADLERAHDKALEQAVCKLWVMPVLTGGDELGAVVQIRQTIVIAKLLKDRTEKLLEALKAK